MADRIKYVDPDNDPIADYTSLNAAIAGLAGDLGGDNLIIRCISSAGSADTTPVDWAENNFSNYGTITIQGYGATGKQKGTWDSSIYRLDCVDPDTTDRDASLNKNKQPNVIIEDLQVGVKVTSGTRYAIAFSKGEHNGCIVRRCILRDSGSTGGNAYGFGNEASPGDTSEMQNCAIYGFTEGTAAGIRQKDDGTAWKIYNNTIQDCKTGITDLSGSWTKIVNNIFQDCTTDVSASSSSNSGNNLTDNSSGLPGSNNVYDSTLAFVDKSGKDFHLAAGDTGAINAGIGPASDSDVPPDDIDGNPRSGTTTDIGFDERTLAAVYPEECGAGESMKVDGAADSYFANCNLAVKKTSAEEALDVEGNIKCSGNVVGGDGAELGSSGNRFSKVYLDSVVDYADHMAFEVSGSEKMRLTSNGSLSLGAQYPTSKFHFQTDIIVGTGTISNDDNDYTLIKEDTTGAFTDLDIGDEITGGGQKRLVVNKQVISNVTWLTVDTAFNPKLTLNSWTYTQRRLAIKETGRIEIGKNEATPAIIIAPPPTGSASVDRTSIQDCIEKAKTNGGGTVILQKGRYSVNQYSDTDYALALRKGVSLIGASANQTIIEVNNPGRSISAVKFEDDTTGLIHWATVSNIKFNRAQADGSGKKHVGIAMIKTQMCKIENVEIKDFMTGIQVTHWINQVVNVKVSECGIGIHINGKPKVRAVSIKSISGSQSQWTVKLDTAYTDIYAGQYLWQGTNNWLITTAQPDPQNSETVLTAEGDQQPTQTSSEIYYINFLDRNINTIITI